MGNMNGGDINGSLHCMVHCISHFFLIENDLKPKTACKTMVDGDGKILLGMRSLFFHAVDPTIVQLVVDESFL